MTHRFDTDTRPDGITVVFQGLLDRGALRELEAHCRAECRTHRPVKLLLGRRTQVVAGLMESLVRLPGVTLEAESPFLSRWLQRCRLEITGQSKEPS